MRITRLQLYHTISMCEMKHIVINIHHIYKNANRYVCTCLYYTYIRYTIFPFTLQLSAYQTEPSNPAAIGGPNPIFPLELPTNPKI